MVSRTLHCFIKYTIKTKKQNEKLKETILCSLYGIILCIM